MIIGKRVIADSQILRKKTLENSKEGSTYFRDFEQRSKFFGLN